MYCRTVVLDIISSSVYTECMTAIVLFLALHFGAEPDQTL